MHSRKPKTPNLRLTSSLSIANLRHGIALSAIPTLLGSLVTAANSSCSTLSINFWSLPTLGLRPGDFPPVQSTGLGSRTHRVSCWSGLCWRTKMGRRVQTRPSPPASSPGLDSVIRCTNAASQSSPRGLPGHWMLQHAGIAGPIRTRDHAGCAAAPYSLPPVSEIGHIVHKHRKPSKLPSLPDFTL